MTRTRTKTPQTEYPPLLVSVEEASKMIGLSKREVHRHLQTGAIASKKCGWRRLIEPRALAAWVASLPSTGEDDAAA